MGETQIWILATFVAYAVVHSLLATGRAKSWAARALGGAGRRLYRLAYNGLAVVSLIPTLALAAADPGPVLYRFPAPLAAAAVLGQLAALAAMVWTLLQTDALRFLGVRQVFEPKEPSTPLIASGLYRWVRHPLYTCALLFLWLTPVMTASLLTLYAAFSAYLIVGSFFEERRLEGEFGEAYREYRRKVPRLIPRIL
jgi:protein-S-isoprenylcysteine O-methyltransferase Ste14